MKTLVITNDYFPKKGGISTYIKSFEDHLEFEKIIYAPNWAEGPNVVNSKSRFIFGSRTHLREINQIINQHNIEIILHASSNPQFYLVNKLKNFGLKQYMIIHGAEFNVIDSIPIVKKIFRRSLESLEKIFTVSYFTGRKLQEITSTEIVLMGAGVEKNEYQKEFNENEKLIVGVSSRFVSRKKIDWVIDSLNDLQMDGYDVTLNIFGYGKLEKYLKKLSDISSQEVNFYSDDDENALDGFYKDLDLFVMPAKSRFFGREYEGLGLVYLEAASYGLPVLVGSSGGAFETIIPGKTGFIVGSRNEIYDAIKYFYENKDMIKEFGSNSKLFVEENFSWESVVEKFKINTN